MSWSWCSSWTPTSSGQGPRSRRGSRRLRVARPTRSPLPACACCLTRLPAPRHAPGTAETDGDKGCHRLPTCVELGQPEREASVAVADANHKDQPGAHPELTDVEVSVVLPFLNEEETVAACVMQAQTWFRRSGVRGEGIVVDNGSAGPPRAG